MICAVLLAGGKSRRMGQNKAFLDLNGRSLFAIQLGKLCSMKFDEILISGDPEILQPAVYDAVTDTRIRIIPDVIAGKGPLGGMYSCFVNTGCTSSLVLCTDTPLIETDTLNRIISHHLEYKEDATVLTAASHIEPLIAAYRTDTAPLIKELLNSERLSVSSLLDRIDTYQLEFDGNPSELLNCNTQEDYRLLLKSFRS